MQKIKFNNFIKEFSCVTLYCLIMQATCLLKWKRVLIWGKFLVLPYWTTEKKKIEIIILK